MRFSLLFSILLFPSIVFATLDIKTGHWEMVSDMNFDSSGLMKKMQASMGKMSAAQREMVMKSLKKAQAPQKQQTCIKDKDIKNPTKLAGVKEGCTSTFKKNTSKYIEIDVVCKDGTKGTSKIRALTPTSMVADISFKPVNGPSVKMKMKGKRVSAKCPKGVK